MNSIYAFGYSVSYIILGIVLGFGCIIFTLCFCRFLYVLVIQIPLPERIAKKRITKILFVIFLVLVFGIGVFINIYMLDIKFTFYAITKYFLTFFYAISIIDIIVLCLYLMFFAVKIVIHLFKDYNWKIPTLFKVQKLY